MGQDQLRVGLVGTGPWATTVHAPGLADHPGTVLSAVWSRRPEAATALAQAYDAVPTSDLDELFEQVDALAFAVPPTVQAELATRAAEAGKHLILEKPIAPDLASAQRLADAVTSAGVASLVMLTLRFAQQTRDWLDGVTAAGGWRGGSVQWLSGALLAGKYATSAWRQDPAGGALADIGPHAFDLLDAALGPITDVLAAHRGPEDLWQLLLEHEGGITSTATLSLRLPVQPTVVEYSVFGEHGLRTLGRTGTANDAYTALLDDFAAMVSCGTTTHPCDVRRGVHLARIVDQARAALSR
ncbi:MULTISPECIES: Gfo/Idh/MocA family protein [Amycolatopsis]|uniref:Gfo/Idh/MocA family oxidoreductase n=1 Tax=Amycolatopsis dendrobii TaxID=2760662 RepID=A0A7W3ZCB6_9PSEU|nr:MULTISPECIES: Gfo/Idh/MocA family oxidoreductase [Amycolatopsis]MBB1155728.1 Gfo/Idh/MocA family oxidoreductase [Amycolatopsis dendrobii]UKD52932.1 Gfo/Idh/MocA family oxidoreductase [Amycolatopsis sp. FU40]